MAVPEELDKDLTRICLGLFGAGLVCWLSGAFGFCEAMIPILFCIWGLTTFYKKLYDD